MAAGSSRTRRLPGRARPRLAPRDRRGPLGLLRVGEALAPRRSKSRKSRSRHFLHWAADELRGRRAHERTGARVLACGRLRAEVFPSRPMMGLAAARAVAEAIQDLLARHGRAAVIFASAPSQNEFLAALRRTRVRLAEGDRVPSRRVRRHRSRPSGVVSPLSRRQALRPRPGRAFHGLDGRAADLAGECARYAGLIGRRRRASPSWGSVRTATSRSSIRRSATSPRPGRASRRARRRLSTTAGPRRLLPEHRRGAAHGAVADVPLLMRVPRAVAIVPGPTKRAAVQAALQGPVTAACPASMLRRHRDATLFLDEASAAGLR